MSELTTFSILQNVTVMGSQYFKGLQTGKCLSMIFSILGSRVAQLLTDVFVLAEFVSLFENELSFRPTASIDCSLNDVR